MRVMTYNIRTGGVDRGRGSRLAAVAAVVNGAAPDLLALQELRDFDRIGGPLHRFADAVQMRPFLARSFFGQPVAVFVRSPVPPARATVLRWGLYHAAAAVRLPTDAGPLTVVSAHLNPFSGALRLHEARRLAAHYARPGELVVLMGDLNGLEPGERHEERVARLPAAYRRRHLRSVRGRPVVDTRAVAALADAGFVDLWRRSGSGGAGDTAPTTQGGGAEFSGMRLDYILASPAAAGYVRDCRVVRGAQSEYASDHYPVVADLDLRLPPGATGFR